MLIKKVINKLLLRYEMIKNHPISGKEPLFAMCRYLFFNISQRLWPRVIKFNWIGGLKFYAELGDAGIIGNYYYGLMDYEDSMSLIDNLKPGDIFVDVGANLGHFSMLASGICKAKVIAIEPIPMTINKLKKNLVLNNLENHVTVSPLGVGAKGGTLNFTTNLSVMNSVALNQDTNTIKVEVKTLDQILRDIEPTFIKIDVEGYEYEVLKGAVKVLKLPSLKFLLVEFNASGKKYNYNNEEVMSLIVKHNFTPVKYIVEEKSMEPIKTYNRHKFNTLFIRM